MVGRVSFEVKALKQYNDWAIYDKLIFKRIRELIKDIFKNPFGGKQRIEH